MQVLRFAIEDFFAVPAPAVAALLASVLCLGAAATIRTVYGAHSQNIAQMLLLAGALIGFSVAGKTIKRR